MFGGIGDADSDRVPLQVGQFESDNRMDEQLRTMFLEGGGGGQKSESYELATYFVARHTATDAWDKRGRKGYLFLIGDEMNKRGLRAEYIRRVIGDQVDVDQSTEAIYREVQQRWETFFVLPRQTAYYDDRQVNEHWRNLLGERLLKLEDPEAVCELIALTVGLLEDAIDLGEGLADLADVGSPHGAAVGKALAAVGGRSVATAGRAPGRPGRRGRSAMTIPSDTPIIVVGLGFGDEAKGRHHRLPLRSGGCRRCGAVQRRRPGGAQRRSPAAGTTRSASSAPAPCPGCRPT